MTAEVVPLFIEPWEDRMRAACVDLKRALAQAETHRAEETTRAEYRAIWDARWRIEELVGEVELGQ